MRAVGGDCLSQVVKQDLSEEVTLIQNHHSISGLTLQPKVALWNLPSAGG